MVGIRPLGKLHIFIYYIFFCLVQIFKDKVPLKEEIVTEDNFAPRFDPIRNLRIIRRF